jgi:hypothetical protein
MISFAASRFRQLLSSRRKRKKFANLILLLLALIFVSLMALWLYVPIVPNAIGKQWISHYTEGVRDDASETIAASTQGGTQLLVKKLEANDWRAIRRSDRAWPAKRIMIQALVKKLEHAGDYDSVQRWAGDWLVLDPRDVHAMAYWYEALRHTTDRRVEGIDGLIKSLRLFPMNYELLRFNSRMLRASGKLHEAARLEKTLNKLTTNNWRLEWRRKSRDVTSWYLGLLAESLVELDFSALWSNFGSIIDLATNSKIHRKLKRHNGEQGFSLGQCKEDLCSINFDVPASSSTINLFPATVPGTSVSEFSITVAGEQHNIAANAVQSRYMYRDGAWFNALGDKDSHVRLSVMPVLGSTEDRTLPATLRFRVRVNAVTSDL